MDRIRMRLPLRWHLVVLVLGVLVPAVLFSAFLLIRLADQQRDAAHRQLGHRARTLADAVDREMSATLRILAALAASEHLDSPDDVSRFDEEARRVHQSQPNWHAIILSDVHGAAVSHTGVPRATPVPPPVDPTSLRRAIATRQPLIGDLARKGGDGRWAFAVRTPVFRNGELRYVLTAVTRPEAVARVIEGGGPSEDEWTRTVVDGEGVVVARTRGGEQFVGKPSTAQFIEHIRSAPEGMFLSTTLDGMPSVVSFSRSAMSQWTSVVVVPQASLVGPAGRTLWIVTGFGVCMVLISGLGAFFLGRRLSREIASAALAAEALARGGEPLVLPSMVAEVAQLREALTGSARLLRTRESERDEHLAKADSARAHAEQANRAKDEFLAMLGHELRNPLAPIVTAIQLLRMKGQGEARELVIIERQVRHLVRLVDDLLEVSRITRGKIELKRTRVELASIVEVALEMVSPLVTARRHVLEINVPKRGAPVFGDAERLAQVVANLLTNAAKYTPHGGHIAVSAKRVEVEGEGDSVELAIEDDGRGIAPELLPHVFDLFVQGPRTPDRQDGGLGLGLTLVRSLVEAHGGRVEAASDGRDKGSRFVVTLPAADEQVVATTAPPAALTRPSSEAPRVSERALDVIVVDDNRDAADVLSALFVAAGHSVRTAHDGASALHAVAESRPDVLIVDIGLPGIDGYEVARRVRASSAGARGPAPVLIALTGYGQPSDRERAIAAGFERHFVKPADPDALLDAVEALAERRRRPEPTDAEGAHA